MLSTLGVPFAKAAITRNPTSSTSSAGPSMTTCALRDRRGRPGLDPARSRGQRIYLRDKLDAITVA